MPTVPGPRSYQALGRTPSSHCGRTQPIARRNGSRKRPVVAPVGLFYALRPSCPYQRRATALPGPRQRAPLSFAWDLLADVQQRQWDARAVRPRGRISRVERA